MNLLIYTHSPHKNKRVFFQGSSMAIKLNKDAVQHAKKLLQEDHVNKEKDNWERCKPTPADEDLYINQHGMQEYGHWYLGIDTEASDSTKKNYEYPYGDFRHVYRSGLIAAEKRAAQNHQEEIEAAARELIDLIDKK